MSLKSDFSMALLMSLKFDFSLASQSVAMKNESYACHRSYSLIHIAQVMAAIAFLWMLQSYQPDQ